MGSKKSELERTFLTRWRQDAPAGLPEPEKQVRFHPDRRWLFDFAWPALKLGVELDGAGGGGYGRPVKCHACGRPVRARKKDGSLGRTLVVPYPSHGSGAGSARDAEKNNAAVRLGWRVLRYTSSQLEDDPGGVIDEVAEMVARSLYPE